MDNKAYCNPEIWGGIECTINRHQDNYFDQLEYSGHYTRESDIRLLASSGIRKIRYPLLWERHQPTVNSTIDWTWAEQQLGQIKAEGMEVIAGLVHHGSGPAYTSLADPAFPSLLASYASKVAEKFPWIEWYTPVNEPVTTARFSGLYGIWYPHGKATKGFAQMLIHELKGTVLAMREIKKINPAAKLLQTEDLGKTYSTPKLQYQARYENERRWLTFDILCGKFNEKHKLWKHFRQLNIPVEELYFFLDNPCPPDLFGFNHYVTSERYIDEKLGQYPSHTHGGNGRHRYADVEAVRVELDEETGIEVLLREAWERFGKPMAITEVHLHCHREEQLRWFRQVWEVACKLKSEGLDLRAITSWAMLGSFGWNRLLTQPRGEYEPGMFDLRSGKPRPTALYHFIREIASKGSCDHPLSQEKGWWQRSSRILFGPVIKNLRMNTTQENPPLLIIGKTGTLGKAFARVCDERSLSYQLIGRQDCDICDAAKVNQMLDHYKPWAVINAAGYVRVDDAEKEPELCFMANTAGPVNLANACSRLGIQLVNFSSDLVFDGEKRQPYLESDPVGPLNIYGQSKALCEKQVLDVHPDSLIIRTSAFFSPWDEYNFVYQVRKALQAGERMTVANDIHISPTYVPDLVHHTLDIVIDKETGIWHLANQGSLTWAELALRTADSFDLDASSLNIVSATGMQYIAPRPTYSVLGTAKGHLLPSLENAMERYIQEKKKEKRQVA